MSLSDHNKASSEPQNSGAAPTAGGASYQAVSSSYTRPPIGLAASTAQSYIESSQRILRQIILPFETGLKSSWTLPQLKNALRSQRQGQLDLSSQLYDTLLEDDELQGSLRKRVNATLHAPFKLISPDGPEEALTLREKKIEKLFCEMVPKAAAQDAIADRLMMGAAVGTLDWDFSGPLWMPTLRMLPTEFLRFDDPTQKWMYTARDQMGEVEVTPGDGKWFLMTSERGWRWGMIRALALTWLGKQLMYLDWQRYSQKHGSPIFKAKIPIWRDQPEKQQFAADLGSVMAEGVIGLPQDETSQGIVSGYDVELLEATTLSWQGFEAGLERADRKFQVMLLGGNLGSEATSKGSNRAAAETHASGTAELAAGDEQELSEALQYQVLRPFMALNYGTDAVPLPFWDANPAEDARSWVPAQAQFMVALQALAKGGVKVKNLEKVGRGLGLELEYSSDGVVDKIAAPPKPDPATKPGVKKPGGAASGKK